MYPSNFIDFLQSLCAVINFPHQIREYFKKRCATKAAAQNKSLGCVREVVRPQQHRQFHSEDPGHYNNPDESPEASSRIKGTHSVFLSIGCL